VNGCLKKYIDIKFACLLACLLVCLLASNLSASTGNNNSNLVSIVTANKIFQPCQSSLNQFASYLASPSSAQPAVVAKSY